MVPWGSDCQVMNIITELPVLIVQVSSELGVTCTFCMPVAF